MIKQDVIAHCRGVYERTLQLWRSVEGQYPTWECRYSILYGPPMQRPDLLILGANPGYDPNDLYDDEIRTWPASNEYTSKNWKLARKLRSIFGAASMENLLENSLGSNVLFFKSKGLGRHESGLGWADNPAHVRTKLEQHCLHELLNLIQVLEPKAILTLGLGVFDSFVEVAARSLIGSTGRRIAAIGTRQTIPVVGIIHPTGAQVANQDWAQVSEFLSEVLGSGSARDRPAVSAPTASAMAPPVQTRAPASSPNRGPNLSRTTMVRAKEKPPATFGYRPIHDFWQELSRLGATSVEDFHRHMVSIGWRRPQGGELTYEVTRTDIASMCKHGFAEKVLDAIL